MPFLRRPDTDATRIAALDALVSHFFQVMNMAITRGVIPREARAHYQLALDASALPTLITRDEVVLGAGRIVSGEAARLAADPAAVPMTMPSPGEVQTALQKYEASAAVQTEAKDTYDDEQEDVAALRPDVDQLLADIWDHIEFTHRADPGPSRRRKSREWGLTYVTRPGETPDLDAPAEETTPAPTPPSPST